MCMCKAGRRLDPDVLGNKMCRVAGPVMSRVTMKVIVSTGTLWGSKGGTDNKYPGYTVILVVSCF